MSLKTIQFPPHRRYKSGTEWEPIGFFSECLCNSTSFDLMLGFFSSSAIRILASGFAVFLYNGGKMRMIINNLLSPQDKQTIIAGQSKTISYVFDLTNISSIQNNLSDEGHHFFECLAWLISNKRIEIKIVQPKDQSGIAHTKFGLFSDERNKVTFEGSCNFTRAALVDNIESFSVSCDWDGEIFRSQIDNIESDFERTFKEEDENLNYINAEQVIDQISNTFGGKDLKTLLEQEKQLSHILIRPHVASAIDAARKKVSEIAKNDDLIKETPHFPYSTGPRDYQKKAFENWKANGQKGLFAMATGTGKTLTALNCLLEVYRKCNYYKALILAPTLTLVDQWEKECLNFGFKNIIKISSKNKWNNEIDGLLLRERLSKQSDLSFVIICTYQSYSKRKVFDVLNGLTARTMFIADECHNMGSPEMLKLLPKINQARRIGLSATPHRQYDETANEAISSFFKATDCYTFEYSMEEAIENGVLCKYYYYPHAVSLTNEEMEAYTKLTKKIVKYYNYDSGKFKDDPILTALLLARKRIIHKAANKVETFRSIIEGYYEKHGNLNYTLVYVPEGNEVGDYKGTEVFDKEEFDEDEVTQSIIDIYTSVVKDVDKDVTVRKFTSNSTGRDEILEQFAKGDISVLTSMKCLDEGVDVPRAEMAVFCASTGNPRQFIQRRGRILRKHPDKEYATIHDLVVIPTINDDECFEMERKLLKNELERVRNFALLSRNSADSFSELLQIMNYYNLNLYDNA